MMQENQSTLLEQAKQGDAKAIASLLNQQLQPKGITAKVANQENCLQIMLEAVQLPNEKALVDFIRKGMTKLGAVGIETVKVYGRQTDKEFPSWHQNIDIKSQNFEQKDDFSFQNSNAGQKNIPTVASKINKVNFYNKPSCPKNYLVTSILVSFFAVLPIGVAAIIFAAQVEGKYNKGDYDGALIRINHSKNTMYSFCCYCGACLSIINRSIWVCSFYTLFDKFSYKFSRKSKRI